VLVNEGDGPTTQGEFVAEALQVEALGQSDVVAVIELVVKPGTSAETNASTSRNGRRK
jgi:hypothetical protein